MLNHDNYKAEGAKVQGKKPRFPHSSQFGNKNLPQRKHLCDRFIQSSNYSSLITGTIMGLRLVFL